MKQMSSVYSHIHQFLKENKEVQKIMNDFKNEYNVDMFDSVKALINMSVNGDIVRNTVSEETDNLRRSLVTIYKKISPDYKKAVDLTFDHLKKFYGEEEVMRGENHYKISDAIATAEKTLGREAIKEEEKTF